MLELADLLGVKVTSDPWDGAGSVPFFLSETYDFRKVDMGGTSCIFAEPRGQPPAIQSIAKHFSIVYSAASLPVVLKATGLSSERKRNLIDARVPFVATGQVFLPFMGVVLQKRLYQEPKSREKLMPSAQMLLFAYLYQDNCKMFTGPMAEKICVSPMQITRATRQLQRLNLFEVSKEGVQIVIRGKLNHRALFEGASQYLLDPVREILYVLRDDIADRLPYAGISAISETTMLAAPNLPTYAYFSRTDRIHGDSVLSDYEKQVRIEVWKYSPEMFSKTNGVSDILSVIVSLKEERDDVRVKQAIDDILNKLWG